MADVFVTVFKALIEADFFTAVVSGFGGGDFADFVICEKRVTIKGIWFYISEHTLLVRLVFF